MGTVNIPVNPLARGGVIAGASAPEVVGDPVNGHFVSPNDGRVFLHVRNLDPTNNFWIKALPAITWDGATLPNKFSSIVANQEKLVGPFPPSMYGSVLNLEVQSNQLRIRAYRLSVVAPPTGAMPKASYSGPRIELPVTEITRDGVTVGAGTGEVTGDPTNDHWFANDGQVVLWARATSVDTSYNFASPLFLDGQPISDYNGIVQIGFPLELAGSYPPRLYNQPDGAVYLNVNSNTIRLRAFWLNVQE